MNDGPDRRFSRPGNELGTPPVQREQEYRHVKTTIENSAETNQVTHLVLYGPSGSGKTLTAKHAITAALDDIPETWCGKEDSIADIEPTTLLQDVARNADEKSRYAAININPGVVIDKIRNWLSTSCSHATLLVEVGTRPQSSDIEQLLDEIRSVNQEAAGNLQLVLLTNTLTVWHGAQGSEADVELVEFDQYTVAELAAVMEERIDQREFPGSVNWIPQNVVRRIARLCADQEDGDARWALKALDDAVWNCVRREGRIVRRTDLPRRLI